MRRALWFVSAAALATAALLLAGGCGTTLGLDSAARITGGSVPVGPTRVAGEALLATDPGAPVADAEVVVTDSTGTARTATTDTFGQFVLESAAPGPARVRVSTPHTRPFEMSFNIPTDGAAQLTLALLPADVTPGEIESLTLDHDGIVTHVGDVVPLRAAQTFRPGPGPGPAPSLAPSWVVEGGVGVIRHGGHGGDAVFVATQVGTGFVVVTSGDRQTRIPVTVSP